MFRSTQSPDNSSLIPWGYPVTLPEDHTDCSRHVKSLASSTTPHQKLSRVICYTRQRLVYGNGDDKKD